MTTKVVISVGDSSIQFKRNLNACIFFGALSADAATIGRDIVSRPSRTSSVGKGSEG